MRSNVQRENFMPMTCGPSKKNKNKATQTVTLLLLSIFKCFSYENICKCNKQYSWRSKPKIARHIRLFKHKFVYLFNFFFRILFSKRTQIERKWEETTNQNNWILSIDGKILEIYNMTKHQYTLYITYTHTHYIHSLTISLENIKKK